MVKSKVKSNYILHYVIFIYELDPKQDKSFLFYSLINLPNKKKDKFVPFLLFIFEPILACSISFYKRKIIQTLCKVPYHRQIQLSMQS